ncbi:MAG: hypothetical protein ACI4XQ_05590 [Eubacteriales bacterium]
MQYSEISRSKLKPVWSFLIALAAVTAIAVAFRSLPIKQYRFVVDIAMIVLMIAIVYFLYRYALTPFEYSVSGDVFSISKGEKHRKTVAAVVRQKDIRFFCPSNYTGKVPKGDYSALNCCPSWKGKTNGWCLWCNFGEGNLVKIYIEPSEHLVGLLKELAGEKAHE